MSFKNKVAFITGAGGGMGLKISQDLLNEGAKVAMIDVKDKPQELDSQSGEFIYIKCDLANEQQVNSAVEKTIAQFGRIDYLANVAGVLWFDKDKSVLDIDLDVWDQVFTINLKSMVHTVRAVAPHLKKQGGAMVHFSTIQCLRGDTAPQDAYQASKAAVVAFSKSLAIQLASHKIRSNVIYPGPAYSPMQQRWDDNEEALKNLASVIPLGRVGRVDDLANACLFLLSDKASFITGTELIVDGGILAKP